MGAQRALDFLRVLLYNTLKKSIGFDLSAKRRNFYSPLRPQTTNAIESVNMPSTPNQPSDKISMIS
jgi:hypothetical protein